MATTGDGLIALSFALAVASIAGCEMMIKTKEPAPQPIPSVEQTCATQWFVTEYCKIMILKMRGKEP